MTTNHRCRFGFGLGPLWFSLPLPGTKGKARCYCRLR
jgi:hypothetical protein